MEILSVGLDSISGGTDVKIDIKGDKDSAGARVDVRTEITENITVQGVVTTDTNGKTHAAGFISFGLRF